MKKISILIGLMMAAGVVFPGFSACEDHAGEFASVQGRVDITSPGEPARPANPGDRVFESDVVRTKSDGWAELKLADGSLIRIAPASRFLIASFIVEKNETRSILNLLRGKIRNIISRTSDRQTQYEVRTKTAIVGVRGTDFFVYYQHGASGAIFKEGEGYAYAVNEPDDIRTIKAGQALLVRSFDTPPIIRPVTQMEMERHSRDTSSSGVSTEESKDIPEAGEMTEAGSGEKGVMKAAGRNRSGAGLRSVSLAEGFGGGVYVDEREIFNEFAFNIDIESFDRDDFFYSLDTKDGAGVRIPEKNVLIRMPLDLDIANLDPDEYLEKAWDLYIGNTPGRFSDGVASGGSIFAGPIVREDIRITDQDWGIGDLYIAGAYEGLNGQTFDQWSLDLNYRESSGRRYYRFEGRAWSDGKIEAKAASAWVNWRECLTGVAGGNLSGTYSPDDGAWKATARFVTLETRRFLDMASNRKNDLEQLDIPCVEIGRASLTGQGNHLTVNMNDVTFFSYATGEAPAIWATNGVSGSFNDTPRTGIPVPMSGNGLNADFIIRAWDSGRWAAGVENGTGALNRSDAGAANVVFQGGAAGSFDTGGTFSGSGAGTAGNQ